MWQGHRDITNKVEKDVKPNQANYVSLFPMSIKTSEANQYHSEQSKQDKPMLCLLFSSYLAVSVYLQTYWSVKHHISPIVVKIGYFSTS